MPFRNTALPKQNGLLSTGEITTTTKTREKVSQTKVLILFIVRLIDRF